MRPIHLRIAGLHSFREAQDVDFATLSVGGVFGIFGPTGSGKSTILDAITLALYGKVERAPNNTQGILNQAEEFCEASFSFSLQGSDDEEVYCVERRYQRSGPHTIRNQVARLLRVDAQGVPIEVLADRDREVTRCVEELLGLTLDDFTRAVVLPQGKFAEFLQLKGSERRQMLQRLFHLEQYGDKLNERLKKELQATQQQLALIQAEQQGLGDVTKERLTAMQQAWDEGKEALAQLHQEQQELESAYADGKACWEWQQQLAHWEERYRQHQRKKPQMLALQKQLQEAQLVERLYPWYDAYRQAVASSTEQKRRWEEACVRFAGVETQFQERRGELERLEQLRQVQVPIWLQEQARLQQLVQVEDEVATLTRWLEETEPMLRKEERDLAILDEKQVRVEQAVLKLRKHAEQFQQELNQLALAHESKQLILKASRSKQEMQLLQQSVIEAKQIWHQGKAKAAQLRDEKRRWGQWFQGWWQEAEQCGTKLKQQSSLVERFQEHQQIALQQLEEGRGLFARRKKEHELTFYAMRLATRLQEGEPCPVCGSLHHQKPVGELEVPVNWEAEGEPLDELQRNWSQLEQELTRLQFQFQHLQSEFQAMIWESGQVRSQSDVSNEEAASGLELSAPLDTFADAPLTSAWDQDAWDQDAWEAGIDSLQRAYAESAAMLEQGKAHFQTVESTVKNLATAWQKGRLQWEKLHLHQQQLELEQSRSEAQLQQLKEKWQAQKLKWQEEYPQISYEEVEFQYQQLLEQGKQGERLRQALERCGLQLQQQEQTLQQLNETRREKETALIRIRTEWETKAGHCQARQEKLEQELKGRRGKELLAEVEERLEGLQQKVVALRGEAQQLEVAREQVLLALEGSKELFHQGEKNRQERTAAWLAACTPFDFSPDEELEARRVAPELQAHWEGELEAYKEQEQTIITNQHQLQQRLGGRWLTAEEWASLQQRWQDRKKQYETLLQQVARQERDVEEYIKRYERHQELEQVRRQLVDQNALLEQLQSVLRGNAFVEYLAEEQLESICIVASERLRSLTHQRYALELDSEGGFIIRDDANGGLRRPVHTLSGGETFLTSLALALALSAQIQLRGEYPLQFFFLDEGFGTLDMELLDTVVTALEKLQTENLSIGVISHVPELRARLPRRLIVTPAEPSGQGSRITMDML